MLHTLSINGQDQQLELEASTPLLFVLRNALGLRGTKAGCMLGQCGACTVLVDGQAERSCLLSVAELAKRDVLTIEGLPDTVLQEAFIAQQAAQCGYCIPGMVMRAAALLQTNPELTRAELAAALKEHICRCGTHTRILKAIESALAVHVGHEAG